MFQALVNKTNAGSHGSVSTSRLKMHQPKAKNSMLVVCTVNTSALKRHPISSLKAYFYLRIKATIDEEDFCRYM